MVEAKIETNRKLPTFCRRFSHRNEAIGLFAKRTTALPISDIARAIVYRNSRSFIPILSKKCRTIPNQFVNIDER